MITQYPTREYSDIQLHEGKFANELVRDTLMEIKFLISVNIETSRDASEFFEGEIRNLCEMLYHDDCEGKFESMHDYGKCLKALNACYNSNGLVGLITRGVVMETFFADGENRLGSMLLDWVRE